VRIALIFLTTHLKETVTGHLQKILLFGDFIHDPFDEGIAVPARGELRLPG
jgi:hypothetical protein